ncbi:MAG: hypothetical protein AAFO07_15350 [Bacteroidota bacterium]
MIDKPKSLKRLPHILTISPKRIFLVDGLGALLSAAYLGILMVVLNEYFGMPVSVLYVLAGIACFFAVYSLSCHFFLKKNWKPFLGFIMTANLLYCVLTLVLVIYHFNGLTTLGVVYFILEMFVIIWIVSLERKVYQSL